MLYSESRGLKLMGTVENKACCLLSLNFLISLLQQNKISARENMKNAIRKNICFFILQLWGEKYFFHTQHINQSLLFDSQRSQISKNFKCSLTCLYRSVSIICLQCRRSIISMFWLLLIAGDHLKSQNTAMANTKHTIKL